MWIHWAERIERTEQNSLADHRFGTGVTRITLLASIMRRSARRAPYHYTLPVFVHKLLCEAED